MKNNKLLKTALISLSIVIILAVGCVLYYFNSLSPIDVDGDAKLVEIPSGYSLKMIGQKLSDEGIIKNSKTFELYVKIQGAANNLKAGKYMILPEYGVSDIVQMLGEGRIAKQSASVTFPEGYTLKQMADTLEQNGFSKDNFLKEAGDIEKYQKQFDFLESITDKDERTLEGYLFPDTYFFKEDDSEETIVKKMLARFDDIFTDKYMGQVEDSGRTIDQIVVLASMVEQESKFDEDRPNVAGVFMNRLKSDMHLQSDVTVLYALGVKKEQVLYKDLKVDSKYNTYKYPGLPIGPIGSFGQASLEAAINPAKHDYYYFIAKKDGHCVFTKTLNEHDEVVEKYLR